MVVSQAIPFIKLSLHAQKPTLVDLPDNKKRKRTHVSVPAQGAQSLFHLITSIRSHREKEETLLPEDPRDWGPSNSAGKRSSFDRRWLPWSVLAYLEDVQRGVGVDPSRLQRTSSRRFKARDRKLHQRCEPAAIRRDFFHALCIWRVRRYGRPRRCGRLYHANPQMKRHHAGVKF